MRSKKGFTLIEVLISVAILGIVGFSIARFVLTSKKVTARISNSGGCEVAAQSILDEITQYGSSLNPADPYFDNSTVVEAEAGDDFVVRFNSLPVYEFLAGGTMRLNTSQLLRGSAAAVMAVYNRIGNSLCTANNGMGIDISNMQYFSGQPEGSTMYLSIKPIDASGAATCAAPPLYFAPTSTEVNYATTPPTFTDMPLLLWGDRNEGFDVQVSLQWSQDGQTKMCQAKTNVKFTFDKTNTSKIDSSLITVVSDSGTNTSFVYDPPGTRPAGKEFLLCGDDGSSDQGFRNVTVNIPINQIEKGSALVCRGSVLDDPSSTFNEVSGDWALCSNFNFPAPYNTGTITSSISSSNFRIRLEQLPTNKTYEIVLAILDSGGNFVRDAGGSFAPLSVIFSVDGERPSIVPLSIQEDNSVTNFIVNPRASFPSLSGQPTSWPDEHERDGIQCGGGTVRLVGQVQGSLLQRTLITCEGVGYNSNPTLNGITCVGDRTGV
ncbi:MAG: prepilin-type N-terminal cleavage/methylation domain-containing protein, partial [Bdellovibrionales bacterium]|nr:prepilin-type N-terminal cleavage/methylation domain-containing protein [Bdellovibrionales bacterium]